MSPEEIKKAREVIECMRSGRRMTTTEVIDAARTGWPEALDEIERLQKEVLNATADIARIHRMVPELRAENERLKEWLSPLTIKKTIDQNIEMLQEIAKLRAIAEAAEDVIAFGETYQPWNRRPSVAGLAKALKSWRGEPGTDANGSPAY